MTTLPAIREEIQLLAGPMADDGSPTWNLFDPSCNRFFRINWQAFEILARWDEGDAEAIAQSIRGQTTLQTTSEEVVYILKFLSANHLLRSASSKDTQQLYRHHQAMQSSWMVWLLHHYLFIRVPLFNPDRLLQRMLPHIEWLYTPWFARLTLLVGLTGVVMVMRQGNIFLHTLLENVSFQGMVSFLLALTLTKVVHEWSHALMAKRCGCRVPTVGLAFMVLWPVLYTDTTDSWKLVSRRQRLLVGAAGMLAELYLAAYATLAWVLLPDSGLRTAAFVLASTTWITTLLVNLSPFMRFDGYFLLMDGLNIPNLHTRAFALATWFLRERLFGLGLANPDPLLPPAKRHLLIAFAITTWLFRLVLFFGIAVMVYQFTIKLLGIFLFLVEIVWFIVRPVHQEFNIWWTLRGEILGHRRSLLALFGLMLVPALLFVPWQSRLTLPALMEAREQITLYAPAAGQLGPFLKQEGELVQAGETIVTIDAPDLTYRLKQVNTRIRLLEWEISAMGFEPAFRRKVQSLEQEMQGAIAERMGLDKEQARLHIRAPKSGVLRDIPPDLKPGQWIPNKERLATILIQPGVTLVTYVPEEEIHRMAPRAEAIFHPNNPDLPASHGQVVVVDTLAAGVLEHPALATLHGGHVPVRQEQELLLPEGAFYRIQLLATSDTPMPRRQTPGTMTMTVERRSLGMRFLHTLFAVLLRESGF